jgi:hypothetical protein
VKRTATVVAALAGLVAVIVVVALLALWASSSLATTVPGHATPAVDAASYVEAHAPVQHEVVVSVTGAPGTVFRVVGEVFGDTGPTNLPNSGGDSAHFQTTKAVGLLDLVVYVSAPVGDDAAGCAIFYDDHLIAQPERVPFDGENVWACRVRFA